MKDRLSDAAKLPAYVGLALPETGYLLVRISKVIDDPKPAEGQEGRSSQLYGAAQYEAYLASLRSRADIDVRKGVLEKK